MSSRKPKRLTQTWLEFGPQPFVFDNCLRQMTLGNLPRPLLHVTGHLQGGQRTDTLCCLRLNLSNIDRFSNLFHCKNQENICNNNVTKDPATPQVCHYTTLWNISVLKATIENKTTSVKTILKLRRTAARWTHWTFELQYNCRMWQLL